MLGKQIEIKFKTIAMVAYTILMLPILIFFWGWLKWYFAALFSGILLIGMAYVWKNDYFDRKESLKIPTKTLVCIGVMFALWILISGNCGVSVSNYDTKWRLATLRDLIDYSWPIQYDKTSYYMVYYHTFWLIPALAGKLFGWHVAMIVQAVWMWLIIMTAFMLISYILKIKETRMFVIAAMLMIVWSGLNVLGWAIMQIFGIAPGNLGLFLCEDYCGALFNGESFNFLYRSNEDFLCENYNQILIWIAVPLMLENKKIRNYAFIGLLLFPYSPWGVGGIGLLMVVDAMYKFVAYIKEGKIIQILKEIFSLPNVCAILSILVVFGLYFMGSSRTGKEGGFGILTIGKFDTPRIIGLIVFWICEFGFYYLLLWKDNKKDYLFKWGLVFLMIIPIVWAGSIWGRDFCMNVSLPILYVLMIYVIKYLKEHVVGKILTIRNFLLILCLFVATLTPLFDWGNKLQIMVAEKSFVVIDDSFYSFSKDDLSNGNYITDDIGLFSFISK